MMSGGTSGLLSNIKSHNVSKKDGGAEGKASYLEGVGAKSKTAADTSAKVEPLTPEVEAIFAAGVTIGLRNFMKFHSSNLTFQRPYLN